MPRAFLIHQKTKAKKAKADSTQQEQNMDNTLQNPQMEDEKTPCEIVRMPFGVSKESTCIAEHTPAKDYHLIPENNKKNFEVGGNKNEAGATPVKNNNIEDKAYQLHSSIGDDEKGVVKNIKMHLSNGRSVENIVSRKIDDSLSSGNLNEERQPSDCKSTTKASTKRTHGNYSILDPLHNTVKRAKLNENNNDIDVVGGDFNEEKVGVLDKDIKRFSEVKQQQQRHEYYEQKSEKDYLLKNPKLLLPSFNKCFQYKKPVEGWGHTIEVQSPSPPQKTTKHNSIINRESKSHYQSQPKELGKEYRKTRPYLPHPYWSPLKIEVPQFEPSPVKMAHSHLIQPNDSYQMCFSPSRNNTSSPNDRPLFVDSLRNQDRVSESERDTASERSCTSDQEMFRDSDSESETSSSQHFASPNTQGPYWGRNMNNKVNGKSRDTATYPHKVISPIECPKEMVTQSSTASSRLRFHDPHFWQNNIPNIPMIDYMRKMAPLQTMQMPEHFHEYPFLPMPHYFNYLNAIEKGVFPYMPSIWRPSELPHHPFIVNPAFMDPRYVMQYQAEKLKCHSPAYPPVKHLTPSPPVYMKEKLEKPVTINEHIHMVERPESLESATSDKYSTISDESATTVDTVISSPKPVVMNEKSMHKITTNSNAVISSTNNTSSTKHHCEWCGKTYSTFSGLTKHKQFHCSKQITKQFNCQHCNKEYTSLGALKMHIRTHTLPCKCHICGKAFSRPWLLQGHIRTHTGEKPFSCQHCSRAFADRSNLRAHLQTHSDVKKYSCDKCSKTFSRMSLLIKHKESGCIGNSQV